MAPHVIFVNSNVYNRTIKKWLGDSPDYPTSEHLNTFLGQLQEKWNEAGNEILEQIRNGLGFGWVQSEFKCYIIGASGGFSDPLSIGYKKNINDGLDTLTHELIHCYLVQPTEEQQAGWQRFKRHYAEHPFLIRNHIAVHALHYYVYSATHRLDRLENDIAKSQKFDAYRTAWEMVLRDGYQSILELLSHNKKMGPNT